MQNNSSHWTSMQNHHMSRCFKSSDMARRQIDGGNNPFFLVLMIVVLSGMYVLLLMHFLAFWCKYKSRGFYFFLTNSQPGQFVVTIEMSAFDFTDQPLPKVNIPSLILMTILTNSLMSVPVKRADVISRAHLLQRNTCLESLIFPKIYK